MADSSSNITTNITNSSSGWEDSVASVLPGVGDNTLVAYVALLLMAVVPIYLGAYRSLPLRKVRCDGVRCWCVCV